MKAILFRDGKPRELTDMPGEDAEKAVEAALYGPTRMLPLTKTLVLAYREDGAELRLPSLYCLYIGGNLQRPTPIYGNAVILRYDPEQDVYRDATPLDMAESCCHIGRNFQ